MASPYEDALKAQAARLPRIQRDTQREILRQLKLAERSLAAQLITAAPGSQAQLRRQQAAVRDAIARFGRAANGAVGSGLDSAWGAGIDLLDKPSLVAGLDLGPHTRIDPRALLAMREFATGRIRDVTVKTIDRINGVLAQVLVGATPMSDAITEIQRILGGATRKRAMTIAYTEIGRAHSAASYAAMQDAQARGVKLGKRWLKSGKLHPRPSHVSAHNQLRRVDEPFEIVDRKTGELEKLRYPRDPKASAGNTINCGCLMVPVLDGSTYGASVIEIPEDRTKPVRKVPRARRDADNRARLEQVNDRLDRFLRSDLGTAGSGLSVTRASSGEASHFGAMTTAPFRPQRASWTGEPPVLIHQLDERLVRGDKSYAAAKSGDALAAYDLVERLVGDALLESLRRLAGGRPPILLPVIAEEAEGRNAIPLALATRLAFSLQWPMDTRVVQANLAARTRKDGYYRLAVQPVFDGPVEAGRDFVLVDDFIGQGATLANLRGHVLARGGRVLGFTSLTGKDVSANLALRPDTLAELRRVHGPDLEHWWTQTLGFGFEDLTESEARYLIGRTDADRVRAELLARIRDL
jgi:hypothetical protein